MVARYHVNEVDGPKVVGEIVDALDQLAREGARLMLERALSAEVDEFMGREPYARGGEFRGYRNGQGRPARWGLGPGRCLSRRREFATYLRRCRRSSRPSCPSGSGCR